MYIHYIHCYCEVRFRNSFCFYEYVYMCCPHSNPENSLQQLSAVRAQATREAEVQRSRKVPLCQEINLLRRQINALYEEKGDGMAGLPGIMMSLEFTMYCAILCM